MRRLSLRSAHRRRRSQPHPGLLREVVSSLRPYRRRIAVAMVVLLAGLGTTLAGPALVGYAINNGLVLHQSMRVVTIAGIAYVGVSGAYFVLTRLQTLQVSGIGECYLNDLRKRVFSHLLAQPLGFFETESSGQLLSRMTADIDVLESLVQSGLSSFVTSIGLFIAVMVVLFVMSPLLCGCGGPVAGAGRNCGGPLPACFDHGVRPGAGADRRRVWHRSTRAWPGCGLCRRSARRAPPSSASRK